MYMYTFHARALYNKDCGYKFIIYHVMHLLVFLIIIIKFCHMSSICHVWSRGHHMSSFIIFSYLSTLLILLNLIFMHLLCINTAIIIYFILQLLQMLYDCIIIP